MRKGDVTSTSTWTSCQSDNSRNSRRLSSTRVPTELGRDAPCHLRRRQHQGMVWLLPKRHPTIRGASKPRRWFRKTCQRTNAASSSPTLVPSTRGVNFGKLTILISQFTLMKSSTLPTIPTCLLSQNSGENDYAHVILTAEADSRPTNEKKLLDECGQVGCHSSEKQWLVSPRKGKFLRIYSTFVGIRCWLQKWTCRNFWIQIWKDVRNTGQGIARTICWAWKVKSSVCSFLHEDNKRWKLTQSSSDVPRPQTQWRKKVPRLQTQWRKKFFDRESLGGRGPWGRDVEDRADIVFSMNLCDHHVLSLASHRIGM